MNVMKKQPGYSSTGVQKSSTGVQILYILSGSGSTSVEILAYAQRIRCTLDEFCAS